MEGSVQESELEVKRNHSVEETNETNETNGANGEKPAAPSYPPQRMRLRTLLPLMGFCCCFYIGVVGWSTLLPQYIMARLRVTDENASVTTDFCNINESDPAYQEEKKLQQKASSISSVASFCAGVPAMFTVLIYSSLSDQLGRKVTIAIPYIGGSIVGVTIAMIVALNGPLWLYFIANFFNGFSGSNSAMLAGVFASVADVTPPERRSIAIAIIQGSVGLAMVLTNLLMGLWAKHSGFTPPIIFLSILVICCGGFFFIVPETRPRSQIMAARQMGLPAAIRKQLRHMKTTVFMDRHRMKQIVVLVVAITFSMLAYMGTPATITLYVLGQPFCWDPSAVGNYHAANIAVTMVGTTVAIVFLKRVTSDLTLAMIGGSSFIGYYVMTGLAAFINTEYHNVMMFVGVAVGAVSTLQNVALKGLGSSLLSQDEQGAFFGVVAIGETFSFSFGPVIMNTIYTATVTSMNFFVYFFCTGLLGIMLVLLVIYKLFLSEEKSAYDVTNAGFRSFERSETVNTLVTDE